MKCHISICVQDFVMLQSALRGHLLRESQLKDLLKDTQVSLTSPLSVL